LTSRTVEMLRPPVEGVVDEPLDSCSSGARLESADQQRFVDSVVERATRAAHASRRSVRTSANATSADPRTKNSAVSVHWNCQ
jgi:hypothetical protein